LGKRRSQPISRILSAVVPCGARRAAARWPAAPSSSRNWRQERRGRRSDL